MTDQDAAAALAAPDDALRTLVGALEDDVAALRDWSLASEAEVLDLGRALGDIDGRIRGTLAALDRLGTAMLDDSGGEAVAVLCRAAEGAAELDRLQHSGMTELATLTDGIRIARAGTDEIRGLLLQLTHLAIIVRTNVRNQQRTQDLLGSFADEVTELIAGGRDTAQGLLQCLRTMERTLAGAKPAAASSAEAGPSDIVVIGIRLGELGRTLERHREVARGRFDEASGRFRAVWSAIGAIVIALQFHDSARQRLEHVIEGIERLIRVAMRHRLDEDGDLLPVERRLQAIDKVARLEAAHLQTLAADCCKVQGELKASLVEVAASLAEAESLFSEIYAGDDRALRGAEGGSVIALVDRELAPIREACAADDRRRALLRSAMEVCVREAEPLADVAVTLTAFEQKLRLSGLNAVIRSARIEGGSAVIGCISRELRQQASAVRHEASHVRDGIERSLAAARSLSQDILPGVQAANTTLQEGVERSAEILRDLDQRARAEHQAARGHAEGVVQHLRGLAGAALPELAAVEPMLQATNRLEALLAMLPPPSEPAMPWPELDEILSCGYTMESERLVHAGSATTEPAAFAASTTDSDDLSDILF